MSSLKEFVAASVLLNNSILISDFQLFSCKNTVSSNLAYFGRDLFCDFKYSYKHQYIHYGTNSTKRISFNSPLVLRSLGDLYCTYYPHKKKLNTQVEDIFKMMYETTTRKDLKLYSRFCT